MELTAIILSIIITFSICYLILFFALNSLDYPNLNIDKILTGKNKYKILVIYPHPDDETMASGGLIAKLAQNSNYNVKCVTITTGQKGDELIKLPPKELGDLRSKEFAKAMKVLEIKDFEAWDFMDGNVKNEDKEIRLRIKELLDKFSPDLIITYEKSGVYGHPDHVALSKVVTEVNKNYPAKLLYATISENQARFAHLPYHMAEEEFSITPAEFKLPIWKYAWRKYRAASNYKSQNLRSGIIPLEVISAVNLYEYYTMEYGSKLVG